MIDFKELPPDGQALEQLIREILLIYDMHPLWSGRGPDQGRDIIATEKLKGLMGNIDRKWLVQCKHFAHAERSVGRNDVGSVIDDCRQAGVQAYLLVCTTQPSSGLVTKLQEISERQENAIHTQIWDSVELEKRLEEIRLFALGHIFFPVSFKNTPWKFFNSGSPNRWTAHYKDYFLHLSSRIAGQHPLLSECEYIISRLEAIKPTGENEVIRPRAIYFDDKHEQFTIFADYLVPHDKEQSLKPSDLNAILNDGQGLHNDSISSWYSATWDIQIRRIHPYSDHFHIDHYKYYNPENGNYQNGIRRGYSICELEHYGDRWR